MHLYVTLPDNIKSVAIEFDESDTYNDIINKVKKECNCDIYEENMMDKTGIMAGELKLFSENEFKIKKLKILNLWNVVSFIDCQDVNLIDIYLLNFNINVQNIFGNTPLIYSSMRNRIDIVELLLQRGADVNLQDNFGYTSLIWASYYGSIEIVKLLLHYKAKINLVTDKGNTALMYASLQGYKEIVEILLHNGADKYIKDKYYNTALSLAYKKDNKNIIEMLL